ncbi:abortive infection family protein [Flavobacterium tructae]|uniref:abortive infection family protein n=1 Tax=Flavobacterium tructae TaxID=1114873 RepID=UPI002551CD18|nr:abortive infection family protein [Flavobacterium tructae]MDL2141789.1 abortive infection family protein [Flavobacterium tructae]
MDLISKKTRNLFQDYFTELGTLRSIANYFDNHDVEEVELPPEITFSSVRRTKVEGYCYSIDWTNPAQVRKILNVYEEILLDLTDSIQDYNRKNEIEWLEKLQRFLLRDGYKFENNKLAPVGQVANFDSLQNATDLLDKTHFQEHIDRIQKSITTDPSLAIGSTKELVEATLKTILTHLEIEIDKNDDVPKLLKKVQKGLEIVPDSIDDAIKGAEMIKILLSNLGSVVIKLTELRNLYGTGHGKEKKRNGLSERHARLAVGAGITLCTFLLETFEYKRTK